MQQENSYRKIHNVGCDIIFVNCAFSRNENNNYFASKKPLEKHLCQIAV